MRLTFILLFFALNAVSADFYWVNGTGNWSDPSHWATTSGGTVFNTSPPDSIDNVYFDSNSFLSANDTVYLDTYFSLCGDFSISNLTFPATFMADPIAIALETHGSFSIDSTANWKFSLPLWLAGFSNHTLTCNTGSTSFISPILIQSPGGQYSLGNNVHCKFFTINDGSFISNSFDVICDSMFTVQSLSYISFGTSLISSEFGMDIFPASTPVTANLSADSCKFKSHYFSTGPDIQNLFLFNVEAYDVTAYLAYFDTLNAHSFSGSRNIVHVLSSLDSVLIINNDIIYYPDSTNDFQTILTGNELIMNGKNHADYIEFTQPVSNFQLGDTLFIHGALIVNSYPGNNGSMSSFSFQSVLSVDTGLVCLDYLLITNIAAIGGAQFFAGYNSLDNGGNTNWQFSACNGSNVWPGDANYDLQVNNLDILTIASAFGSSGPVRPSASLLWVGQPCIDWTDTLVTGLNVKHADCDGSGNIDFSDTLAVYQNYGMNHPARSIQQPMQVMSGGSLSVTIANDTIGLNQAIRINIDLGEVSDPVSAIYGIAFDVHFNSSLAEVDTTSFDYSNSWMGEYGTDMIAMAKSDGAGTIHFALSSITHSDLSGFGNIVSFDLISTGANLNSSTLQIQPSQVVAMQTNEIYESVISTGDSAVIDSSFITIIPEHQHIEMEIYPNPAQNYVLVNFKNASKHLISITDIAGRIVFSSEFEKTNNRIDVSQFENGYYLIRVDNEPAKQLLVFRQ
ncbi:MAG: T9SS type A sorting domain-containing protein [Bacteroidetes bacterium]|nr:T9SS type A sorting domain-containing protein [Bacteroidota bacterium]MBL0032731.1 T9SS type A sorting domain-containing protein [Bacteroidota bacterium]MBP7306079.1 T9SS type A sorting domain-containing protein [Saprospiraceae bacterium]